MCRTFEGRREKEYRGTLCVCVCAGEGEWGVEGCHCIGAHYVMPVKTA